MLNSGFHHDAFLLEMSSSARIGITLLCSHYTLPLFRKLSASCRYLACSECGGKNEKSSFCSFRSCTSFGGLRFI